jgi:hypothetical protein
MTNVVNGGSKSTIMILFGVRTISMSIETPSLNILNSSL